MEKLYKCGGGFGYADEVGMLLLFFGREKVGTTSGSSPCMATLTESATVPSLVAQTPFSRMSERLFQLPPLIPFPVGKLLSFGILVPVFGRTSAFPYVRPKYHGAGRFWRLTSAERVATGVGSIAHGPPKRNPTR